MPVTTFIKIAQVMSYANKFSILKNNRDMAVRAIAYFYSKLAALVHRVAVNFCFGQLFSAKYVHLYLLSVIAKEVRQVWMGGPVFDNTVAVDFQIDVIAIIVARHDVGNIAVALGDNLSIAVN